jgi:hypothetical protein
MFASQENALPVSVWDTGDRIGAAPSRRLCSVSHTHASSSIAMGVGVDAAALSLKQISVTHNEKLLSTSLTGSSALQKYGASGEHMKPKRLVRNWGIDLTTARRTIEVTTQRGNRTVWHPKLSRQFRMNDRQLRYRRLGIDCSTDTRISNSHSLTPQQHVCPNILDVRCMVPSISYVEEVNGS